MSTFSIIVPVYKTEAFLDECIRSVLEQTYTDFELILVDDGSPDNSGIICDSWKTKDARVDVIHQQNGGLSAARNAGIRHASGMYLLFLDSDDWWADQNVLQTIAEQLRKTPVDVLSFNYRKMFDGIPAPLYFSEDIADSEHEETLNEIAAHNVWVTGACNKAIRRDLIIRDALYFRVGITSEDVDWTLRLALSAEHFAFANVCVFMYRQHTESISHTPSLKTVRCLSENVRVCLSVLQTASILKQRCLRNFVSFQFAVLVYNISLLSEEERSLFLTDLHDMQYVLHWGTNKPIRLIRVCRRLFGWSFTLWALKQWQSIRQKQKRML